MASTSLLVYNMPDPLASFKFFCDNLRFIFCAFAVTTLDLSAKLKYITVPKSSPNAYMKAAVRNTSEYELLEGQANIHVDGSFVGTSTMKVSFFFFFYFFFPAKKAFCLIPRRPSVCKTDRQPARRFRSGHRHRPFDSCCLQTCRQTPPDSRNR